MKKIMRTSNLAMRFYERDGWTLEELNSLRKDNKGEFHYQKGWTDEDNYFIPAVGTSMKPKELAKIVTIKKTFDDYPDETDEECIERFNW